MANRSQIPTFQGRTATSWLRDLVLGPEDESKFEAAERAFAAMSETALPWLADELSKEELTAVRAAKLSLAVYAIGPGAASLIPVLVRILEKYPDSITYALSGLGDNAIPTFIQILRHPNAHIRMRACESLDSAVQFHGLDRRPLLELIPELLTLLEHDWHMLRWRAAGLLGALQGDPERCIPALMRCLEDRFPEVRGAAATALGYYGDRASIALPRLLELSGANDRALRSFAISAFGYFSDPRVLPVLIAALRDPAVSTPAAYSIGRGKWPSELFVPALCDCVRGGDYTLSWVATEILERLGGEAGEAVPVLSSSMAGACPRLRDKMIEALKRIQSRRESGEQPAGRDEPPPR